jgi:multidrug resistance protein MdtO
LQVALAFYLINLQEFKMQTSLAVARDRVAGILLGLFIMWLVFDQLWGTRAAIEMKRTFVSSLRLLAQLAREPLSTDQRIAIRRGITLRETINANLDKVRALADGVLFEFGSSRHGDLELRKHIRRWNPELRTLFVMRIASLKYRLQLPGFELPERVRRRQQEYDDYSARILEEIADGIEHNVAQPTDTAGDSEKFLKGTLQELQAEEYQPLPIARVRSLVTLLHGIDGLTASLAAEIAAEFGGPSAHSQS